MTITEFLTARLDEDEAVAGAADALGQVADRITSSSCDEFAEHIARHDPVRVLAAVTAKRRAVEACTVAMPEYGKPPEAWPRRAIGERYDVLRALALEWADHADYDERWTL